MDPDLILPTEIAKERKALQPEDGAGAQVWALYRDYHHAMIVEREAFEHVRLKSFDVKAKIVDGLGRVEVTQHLGDRHRLQEEVARSRLPRTAYLPSTRPVVSVDANDASVTLIVAQRPSRKLNPGARHFIAS